MGEHLYGQSQDGHTCNCVHPDLYGVGDFDPATHCIETKLEAIGEGCYNLYVYQHQHQPSLDNASTWGCDSGARGPQSYLTFEFGDLACWNNNDVDLQVVPWTDNTTYDPVQTNWYWDSSGTQFNAYQIAPSYTGAVHVPKFTFTRRNNEDGSPNPFLECRIDTFRICMGCVDSLPASCIDELTLEVYFSDQSGNPNCTNELTNGRDRDTLDLRPMRCPDPELCDTTCTLYESSCNTVNVEWGCDYADVEIINDHAYPSCGALGEFRIKFAADGMSLCENDPMFADGSGNSKRIPGFRDWTSAYDPASKTMFFRAPPGCGLQPCDTFRIRIPFCCEEEAEVGLLFGGDVCEQYKYPGSDSTMRPLRHAFAEPPPCGDCYMDRDRGMISEAMVCILDSNLDGKCDVWAEDISGCDTLTLFNRNHDPSQGSGSGCGDDETGNRCWTQIDLQLDPTKGEPCAISVPRFDPGATITEVPVGSGHYIIAGIQVCGCDSVSIIVCCYNGSIVWTTSDGSGPIQTDSVRGDWDQGCAGLKQPSPSSPEEVDFTRSSDRGVEVGDAIPNPAAQRTTVELTATSHVDDVIVEVYTAEGVLRFTESRHVHGTGTVNFEFDVSRWPSGVYFVRFTTSDRRVVGTSFSVRK